MRMFFLDEAGYTPDWTTGITDQPFYVLSAVGIEADRLASGYEALRRGEASLNLPEASTPLGQGREIKAREIATGTGWWRNNDESRNGIRDLMLSWPKVQGGTAMLVVIDKAAHQQKYYTPKNPYILALQFMLERIEHHLAAREDYGYCVYDHNKRLEGELHSNTASLMRDGSQITYFSAYYGGDVSRNMRIPHILELGLGSSVNSLGLQVADFFATFAYQYFKQRKPEAARSGWWHTLEQSLDSRDGVVDGVGLKVFP